MPDNQDKAHPSQKQGTQPELATPREGQHQKRNPVSKSRTLLREVITIVCWSLILAAIVAKNDILVVHWYRIAANLGSAVSMNNLGVMYANGQGGLVKDNFEAVKWYKKSAEAGDSSGMYNLGIMYAKGQGGLVKDDVESVKWVRKSAEAGNTYGMLGLGFIYESGRAGLRANKEEAIAWYRKAAKLGNDDAKSALKRLGLPE